MKNVSTFWQAVRDFWRTGKTGIVLFLISLLALIYGYIALEFEISQNWKGHVSVQNVTKDISAFIPVGGAIVAMIIGVVDLMMLLSDFIEARREKRIAAAVAAASEEAKAIGKEQGLEQGLEQGREEVYRAWYANWEKRKTTATEKGLPFDEPPPPNPNNHSKVK